MISILLVEGGSGALARRLPEARVCRGVDEALGHLRDRAPAVLVVELESAGVEGLARLEPFRRGFPIVAWVPEGPEDLEEEALAAGAQEFLAGGDREDLLRAVRRAWLRHAAWREASDSLPSWGEALPTDERLAEAAERYGDLLDRALEGRVNGDARHLADDLGLLQAGPVDLVEIHKAALEARAQRPAAEARRYVAQGRLLLLQVMGWLADHYRTEARSR